VENISTEQQHLRTTSSSSKANLREKSEEKKEEQQLWLKTISIHSYSQLSELQDHFCDNKEPVILIARITPIVTKNIEEAMKLINEVYSMATKKIICFSLRRRKNYPSSI
jgi:SepF-like predicted cell division protein (DUF552 family)